ncbi:hypothetical protein LR013_01865 [candidate division NPL-UPA2 bacterium]|nr:hypothetical protein [candidate division NPL-UPA2 bacterium]
MKSHQFTLNMTLGDLLSQKGLVIESPALSLIVERAKSIYPDALKLFYGETYDEEGNPVDSMKYYLFLANFSEVCQAEGIEANPTVLVADSAACRNVSDRLQMKYLRLGEERAEFVRRVNEIYKTNLNILKMSEYIDSEEFVRKREAIRELCSKNPRLLEMIEKSVPPSKVEIERQKGFMYSFDEVTTILDLDIKIGPPREELYDNIVNELAGKLSSRKLLSVFLSPTYPLGLGWDYFFAHEDIERYGITPYKAGSKRLHKHRIIVGKTTPQEAEELIDNSFLSGDPGLPNPVLDLGIIVEMVKQRIQGELRPIKLYEQFYKGELMSSDLKKEVAKDLEGYILSKFK